MLHPFTHAVWVPDSVTGRWEADILAANIPLIRVCREGEAVAVAAGLMLGGASPLVIVQCTGFFEAGDAMRNVVYDLQLPLKMVVGVRGAVAAKKGPVADTCPRFTEPLVAAWGLPYAWADPSNVNWAGFAAEPGAGVLLWPE